MQLFESFIEFLDGYLGSAIYFPFLLLGVGVFFTLYLGFPQIRYFKHAWGVLEGMEHYNFLGEIRISEEEQPDVEARAL